MSNDPNVSVYWPSAWNTIHLQTIELHRSSAVAMQLSCIAVSKQLQLDSRRCTSDSRAVLLAATMSQMSGLNQSTKCRNKRKNDVTTKKSFEKVIKIIYDLLSSSWVARNRFTRSHTIFRCCFFFFWFAHSINVSIALRFSNGIFIIGNFWSFFFSTLSQTHQAINVEHRPAVVRKTHKLSTVGTAIHVALWHIQFPSFFFFADWMVPVCAKIFDSDFISIGVFSI